MLYPLRNVNGPECSFLSKNDLLNLNVSFNISTIAENSPKVLAGNSRTMGEKSRKYLQE